MRAGLAVVVLVAAGWGVAARALAEEPPVTECDRLAAAPGSVVGVAGVPLEDIDPVAAVAACERAVREHPGVARFAFHYGRALQRSGDHAAAAQLYAWAAADGLAAAETALQQVRQAEDSAPAASDMRAAAENLDSIADVLEEVARDAPRGRFDPLAVLQPAGVSAGALTDWVSREVALVPYRGSLRGSAGVLMDRYANSLDRSLLLADLLSAAGYQVRLARVTLDPAKADTLAAAFVPPPEEQPAIDGADLANALSAAAGAGSGLDAKLEEAVRQAGQLRAEIAARTERLTGELLAELGGLPMDATDAAAASFTDHWWVQVQDGSAWVDADPSSRLVGPLMPEETFAPADLPADLRHRVMLRVIVEVWDRGSLREETLLSQAVTPADVIDRPIVLRHVPVSLSSPQELLADNETDPLPNVLAAAADAWVWQPELTIGDEVVIERLFTTAGDVLPAGEETLRSLGIDAGMFGDLDAVGSLFDDGPPPEPAGPPDEANAAVRISAAWLEVEIAVPGQAPVTHRRPVFDLLGPAARAEGTVPPPNLGADERLQRALGLMREVDIMIVGAAPAPSFLHGVLTRDGARLLRMVAPLLRSPEDWQSIAFAPPPRIPLPLYRQAQLRFADSPHRPYLDRPNVMLAWTGYASTGAGGLEARLLYDIVANDVGVPAGDHRFIARVAQGVRDTVVEDALAGPTGSGAADAYEADKAAGRDWVRLEPGDDGALAALAVPAEARAAIAADLAAGAIVLAPPSGSAAGQESAWWRIDAATGTTLGMTVLGGAVITEEAVMYTQFGLQVGGCFVFLAVAIGEGNRGGAAGAALCLAGGVTGGVAGGIGGSVLASTTALLGGLIAAGTN